MTGSNSRDLVLTFAFETYADTVERGFFTPDALVAHLLSEPIGDRLLVADPLRSRLSRLRRRGPRPRFPVSAKAFHVTPHALPGAEPADLESALRKHRRYLRQVRAAATNIGMTDPLLLATHPFTAAAAADWPGEVVYYGWDDWAAHPAFERSWPAYRGAYEAIARARRRVVAVAPAIIERIASPADSLVLPNGLIADEWRNAPPPPHWLEQIPKPRVVYCGAVDSRLDLDAIDALALARPEWSIIIAGPIGSETVRAHLSAIPAVRCVGRLERDDVRALNAGADVAIIPHVVSDLTRSMSPLKLYEYLAAGAPVVAIDLPTIPDHPAVYRYRTTSEFVTQFDAAALRGRATDAERWEFIESNCWESRFRQLADFLDRTEYPFPQSGGC